MCEFISWIEDGDKVLFLTADDVKGKYGRQALEGCLHNDYLGHGAIRKFYSKNGKPFSGGADRENKSFWNRKLPQEIKDAWNKGELDGMMRYLQTDDLEHIVSKAPADFVQWVMAQRYGRDYEAMKIDSNWAIKLEGYAAMQDFEGMKKDDNALIRLAGYAATQDFEAMKIDDYWLIRMVGCAATQDFEAMKRESYEYARIAGYVATQDFAAMQRDSYWLPRLAGGYIHQYVGITKLGGYSTSNTLDIEAMEIDRKACVRLRKYAAAQDFEAMKKDIYLPARLMGYIITQDLEAMKRDSYLPIKLVGYVLAQDFEAMKRDIYEYVRQVGYVATYNPATYNPATLVRPRL